jgi:hypothetical protein
MCTDSLFISWKQLFQYTAITVGRNDSKIGGMCDVVPSLVIRNVSEDNRSKK